MELHGEPSLRLRQTVIHSNARTRIRLHSIPEPQGPESRSTAQTSSGRTGSHGNELRVTQMAVKRAEEMGDRTR